MVTTVELTGPGEIASDLDDNDQMEIADLIDDEDYATAVKYLLRLPMTKLQPDELSRWSELLSQVALRVPSQLPEYLAVLPVLYRQYLLDETILELVKAADYFNCDNTTDSTGTTSAMTTDSAIRSAVMAIVAAGGEVFTTAAFETAVDHQLYHTIAYFMSLLDPEQDDHMEHIETALLIVADSKNRDDQDLLEMLWLAVDEDSSVKYDAEDLIRKNGVLSLIQ